MSPCNCGQQCGASTRQPPEHQHTFLSTLWSIISSTLKLFATRSAPVCTWPCVARGQQVVHFLVFVILISFLIFAVFTRAAILLGNVFFFFRGLVVGVGLLAEGNLDVDFDVATGVGDNVGANVGNAGVGLLVVANGWKARVSLRPHLFARMILACP